MVTTTTAEQTAGKRKRGRPAGSGKKYAVQMATPTTGEGGGTPWQKLIKTFNNDTLVKGYANLRRKLFNSGEPVDQITASLKRRIADLQAASAQH